MAVNIKGNPMLKLLTISVVVMLLVFTVLAKISSRSTPAIDGPSRQIHQDTVTVDLDNETLNYVASQFRQTTQAVEALKNQQAESDTLLASLKTEINRLNSEEHKGEPEEGRHYASLDGDYLIHDSEQDAGVYQSQPLGIVDDVTYHIRMEVQKNQVEPSVPVDDIQTSAPDDAIPYYTIPANATAIQTTLMTAIIGRVPQKGKVNDPYPFKLILGNDILAANGHELQGLAGIVLSGIAIGDLSPKGARGWITSMTFIFPDGTISTTSINDDNAVDFNKRNTLGFITDRYGNPAIPGVLVTDAPRQIAQMMALGFAKGASGAFAYSQVGYGGNPYGGYWGEITGDSYKYAIGRAGEEAVSQAMKWLSDRIESTFDAIVVPAGEQIAIHFTREIPIDYDPNGRRLTYEQPFSKAYYSSGLH